MVRVVEVLVIPVGLAVAVAVAMTVVVPRMLLVVVIVISVVEKGLVMVEEEMVVDLLELELRTVGTTVLVLGIKPGPLKEQLVLLTAVPPCLVPA